MLACSLAVRGRAGRLPLFHAPALSGAVNPTCLHQAGGTCLCMKRPHVCGAAHMLCSPCGAKPWVLFGLCTSSPKALAQVGKMLRCSRKWPGHSPWFVQNITACCVCEGEVCWWHRQHHHAQAQCRECLRSSSAVGPIQVGLVLCRARNWVCMPAHVRGVPPRHATLFPSQRCIAKRLGDRTPALCGCVPVQAVGHLHQLLQQLLGPV